MRFCAAALPGDSSPPQSLSPLPSARDTRAAVVCRPMVHPWTTYKVRRVCEACLERRRRFDERVREVREGLEGLKGWMGERGLLEQTGSSSEGDREREEERVERDGEEEREGGDGEGEVEEDEMIAYIHPFIR